MQDEQESAKREFVRVNNRILDRSNFATLRPSCWLQLRTDRLAIIIRTVSSGQPPDVPSPVDLRRSDDAQAWASTAMQRHPSREEFFQAIVEELRFPKQNGLSILELGSGPGFLALRVLQNVPVSTYIAVDFSPAMHALARQRLGALAECVKFLEADFKRSDWVVGLPSFDAVLSVQAIHELRHKRHATPIYRSIRPLLNKGGIFLVCDHFVT